MMPLLVTLSAVQVFKTGEEAQNAECSVGTHGRGTAVTTERPALSIAASMSKSVLSKSASSGNTRPHEHEILFYNLPDLTTSTVRCGDETKKKDKTNTASHPCYMVQLAQAVEIMHYPWTVVLGNMNIDYINPGDAVSRVQSVQALSSNACEKASGLDELPFELYAFLLFIEDTFLLFIEDTFLLFIEDTFLLPIDDVL
ncbi:hypothetical protein EC991_005437 [Linnemannia zychae]|nr:hypothetical protein EC991_005437 [Linnemannia zychae]